MSNKKFGIPLRSLAVLIFLPGLYLILLLAGAISLAFAALGIKLGITVAGRFPVGGVTIVAACTGAGAAGVFSVVRAVIESRKGASVRVPALRVSRSHAAGIWDLISKISRGLKTPMPKNLILELGTDVFVVDGVVHTYDFSLTGRTLCISAPLLRVLKVAEFEAVLSHEMAHFTGDDTLYSHYFYPVYRGSARAVSALHAEASESAWKLFILFVPMALVAGFCRLFTHIEKKISRTRELRADAIAAETSGPETMVQALTKLHAYGSLWQVTDAWMVSWLKESNAFTNISSFFVEYFRRDVPSLARSLQATAELTHPLNSHPSLLQRVQALGRSYVKPDFETTGPVATTLFPELEAFEERLTELQTREIMKVRSGHFYTKRKQPDYEAPAVGRGT